MLLPWSFRYDAQSRPFSSPALPTNVASFDRSAAAAGATKTMKARVVQGWATSICAVALIFPPVMIVSFQSGRRSRVTRPRQLAAATMDQLRLRKRARHEGIDICAPVPLWRQNKIGLMRPHNAEGHVAMSPRCVPLVRHASPRTIQYENSDYPVKSGFRDGGKATARAPMVR